MGYHLSASAHADIDEIWDFIAEDNPAAAERFTAMLREKFSILASQPQMGRACAELRPGLHRFPIGNYVVFYRPVADQVEIARVLHARGISKPFSKRKKLHESRAHKGPSPWPEEALPFRRSLRRRRRRDYRILFTVFESAVRALHIRRGAQEALNQAGRNAHG